MSTIINATTTNGVVIQPDNSGSLVLQTNNGTTALTIDTSQRAAFVAGTAALPAITTTGDTNTGIFFPAADTIAFAEGGAEAMRLDSSGNVGIGTASPSAILQVNSTAATVRPIVTATTGYTDWVVANTGGNLYFGIDNSVGGVSGTAYGRHIYSDGVYPLDFFTNSTQRMRIDSSGNLQVGTTSGGSERLYVTQSVNSSTAYFLNNNGTTATQYGIVVKLNGDPNNTNHMVQCIGNTTTRAEIRANGGIANYSANNVNLSDQREKTNVELASSYLDKICAIPVKTFNYIDQNMEEDGGLTLGVIAQDVQAVAPELVMESNWAGKDEPEKLRLSIYQTDLQYALMKCIQEQQTIINDLKARIETLEAK